MEFVKQIKYAIFLFATPPFSRFLVQVIQRSGLELNIDTNYRMNEGVNFDINRIAPFENLCHILLVHIEMYSLDIIFSKFPQFNRF